MESNPCGSINTILVLNANDTIKVDSDVGINATVVNVCGFIREIVLNKKIVNNVITNANTIDTLADTTITAPIADGSVLMYDSVS